MEAKSKVLYSFGDYLLEVSEKRLWKDKMLVSLTPKAFETLVVLVANRGRVVEKEVLLDKIWANTFVEEGTLAQNILTLRKALGTLSDGRQFIETVPRTGYRFISEVKEIISDDEIVILERRVKTEITSEHQTRSDEAIAVKTKTAPKTSFLNWVSTHKTFAVTAGLSTTLLLAVVAFSIRYAVTPESFSSSKFNNINITKLTSEGNISRAAISPDGKYLVFSAIHPNGERSISVKQIDNSATVQILPPQKDSIIGLTFSPDGNQIYFIKYTKAESGVQLMGHLYQIPMLGGTPREILSDLDSSVAISPDGRQITFVRYSATEKIALLMVSGIDGKVERVVASRKLVESFSSNGLSWSPDGKTIVCSAFVSGAIGKQMELLLVDVTTGEQKTLSKENWLWVGQPDWLKDGSGIIVPAWNSHSGNNTDEIWLVTIEGVTRQISSGVNGVYSLNLTNDSNSLMAIKSERITDFWTASAPNFQQTNAKVLQNRTEFNRSFPGISWLSDSQVVFGSTFNGNLDIWTMKADGSERKPVTNDKAADFSPIASNDGQAIIFISNRLGRENLWKMKADGNKQEQLTDEINVAFPNISPDNQTVYYLSLDEKQGKYFLRKINLETRESIQITNYPTTYPQLSPDGKFVACYYPDLSAHPINESNLKLTIFSTETNEIIKQFDAPYNQSRLSLIEWKGSQSVSYLTNIDGNTKIWEQPVDGKQPQLLLELPKTSVFRFAWSKDGKNLIYEKGETLNDAILISSSKSTE